MQVDNAEKSSKKTPFKVKYHSLVAIFLWLAFKQILWVKSHYVDIVISLDYLSEIVQEISKVKSEFNNL